ncbi:hypothetical protein HMPREF0083_01395 [Aneurinibacillus aneurinilyticus ATCC 12856]|uniref:Uncharacterized protein n=1 Tax=Aneurinibacillus aneurinilyticus ATCC 12856 TaxID=649747 RepID=U1WPF9_ANEAE|nr:hypothetical protein HMPREF0083_01395 [Aneurinibacillus aneurinilyticus ATCC 12856]
MATFSFHRTVQTYLRQETNSNLNFLNNMFFSILLWYDKKRQRFQK